MSANIIVNYCLLLLFLIHFVPYCFPILTMKIKIACKFQRQIIVYFAKCWLYIQHAYYTYIVGCRSALHKTGWFCSSFQRLSLLKLNKHCIGNLNVDIYWKWQSYFQTYPHIYHTIIIIIIIIITKFFTSSSFPNAGSNIPGPKND